MLNILFRYCDYIEATNKYGLVYIVYGMSHDTLSTEELGIIYSYGYYVVVFPTICNYVMIGKFS